MSQEAEWYKRYVADTPAKTDFQIEFDKRVKPNQEEPPGTKVLRFRYLPQKNINSQKPLPAFGPSREHLLTVEEHFGEDQDDSQDVF